MKIILLSGGSGKRLWPLSNDARSKQFLRLLTNPSGDKESMIQRVVRQIKSTRLADDIVVATGINQKDAIENQLGEELSIVTEPCRRDTFPAIMLACSYLAAKGTPASEPVAVMPCDAYTEDAYFEAIKRMGEAVADGVADLVLMGIEPTRPSSKFGYIVPDRDKERDGAMPVRRFTEKPDRATAEKLIEMGALWNGGVFAFRLGYLMDIASRTAPGMGFTQIRDAYHTMPKISFDYEVVEKAQSVAVVKYSGQWKDLGTWNALTEELDDNIYGNAHTESCRNTYVINELEIPVVCIGTHDTVVAASPDGILVADSAMSENLKGIVDGIGKRPMYEERRWGEYKIIDTMEFPDGFCALTKQIHLRAGCSISYQRHSLREETWTFINGEGETVVDGERRRVGRGDVVSIPAGRLHAIRAITPLTFIEVQQGSSLVEDDIERHPFDWQQIP